jgi:hypothetical protein
VYADAIGSRNPANIRIAPMPPIFFSASKFMIFSYDF